MSDIPKNLIALASHGTAEVPLFLQQNIKLEPFYLEHFSDFATWNLLDYIPEHQKLKPMYGRIAGDPNRSPDAADLFRETDFYGNSIWHEPLAKETKEWLLSLSYEPYHQGVDQMLHDYAQNSRGPLLMVDIHDYPTRYNLPMVILSDADGLSANPEAIALLKQGFIKWFGLSSDEVQVNVHYKGGHVTRHYGSKSYEDAQGQPLIKNVIQIELNRLFYMDPKDESVHEGALADTAEKLTNLLADVATKIGDLDTAVLTAPDQKRQIAYV